MFPRVSPVKCEVQSWHPPMCLSWMNLSGKPWKRAAPLPLPPCSPFTLGFLSQVVLGLSVLLCVCKCRLPLCSCSCSVFLSLFKIFQSHWACLAADSPSVCFPGGSQNGERSKCQTGKRWKTAERSSGQGEHSPLHHQTRLFTSLLWGFLFSFFRSTSYRRRFRPWRRSCSPPRPPRWVSFPLWEREEGWRLPSGRATAGTRAPPPPCWGRSLTRRPRSPSYASVGR